MDSKSESNQLANLLNGGRDSGSTGFDFLGLKFWEPKARRLKARSNVLNLFELSLTKSFGVQILKKNFVYQNFWSRRFLKQKNLSQKLKNDGKEKLI